MLLQDVIEKSKELRQDNKTLKLLELIWKNPGIARRDIGVLAKLSRGTVTTNIAQLMNDGYIVEGESLSDNGNRLGRGTTGLYVVPDFFYSIGVSFSFEMPQAKLFDASGRVVKTIILNLVCSTTNCFEHNLGELERAIREFQTSVPPSKIIAIGLSVAGIIDFDTGDVFSSAILDGFGTFNLKTFLRDKFGLESFLINVSHLRPVMEKKWGAAKDMDDFITLSDSCAVGFFMNGTLCRGWQKHAGELSFMKVTESQEIGEDGRRGLLELSVPFYLLRNRLTEMIAKGARLKIQEFMKSPQEEISLNLVVRSIVSGDKFLEQQMAERYEKIAEGVLNAAYLLNPEAVFLEEWTSQCPQCTIDIVERKMGSYGLSRWHLKTRILSSQCSRDMIPRAVAYLASETVFKNAESARGEE